MAASGHRDDFLRILTWMALVHAVIGVGEALITGLVVRFVLLRRPDLLEPIEGSADRTAPAADGCVRRSPGLAIALGVAVFLGPFAWDAPDGLEYVGEQVGFLEAGSAPSPLRSPMADYQLKLPGLDHARVATALAGLVGTLVVFGVGWGMAACCRAGIAKGSRPMQLDGLERHRAGPGRSTGSMPGSSSSRSWRSSSS